MRKKRDEGWGRKSISLGYLNRSQAHRTFPRIRTSRHTPFDPSRIYRLYSIRDTKTKYNVNRIQISLPVETAYQKTLLIHVEGDAKRHPLKSLACCKRGKPRVHSARTMHYVRLKGKVPLFLFLSYRHPHQVRHIFRLLRLPTP